MNLYDKWEKIAYQIDTQEDYDQFWGDYLPKETTFYEYLLENPNEVLEKNIVGLSEMFKVDTVTAVGFIDGVNSSLKTEIDTKNLKEDSLVKLDVDYEKLYYNMLDAKAEWLYSLPGWDAIIDPEKRKEITKEYNKSKTYVNENKIGRNDDCPCGSGKKYKKCCAKADKQPI